jgi:hypothetical protein
MPWKGESLLGKREALNSNPSSSKTKTKTSQGQLKCWVQSPILQNQNPNKKTPEETCLDNILGQTKALTCSASHPAL